MKQAAQFFETNQVRRSHQHDGAENRLGQVVKEG